MKKIFTFILICSLVFSFHMLPTSATSNNEDPNYAFHLKVSQDIEAIRAERNEEIKKIENEIEVYRNQSQMLLESKSNYNNNLQTQYNTIIDTIDTLNIKIENTKIIYQNNIETYLTENNFTICNENNLIADPEKNLHTSDTDAGYMQTTSSVAYNNSTQEFYYYVEYDYNEKSIFGAYLGLHDTSGGYDFVSMQHKDTEEWFWNNIIVTTELASDFYGNSCAGKADKYGIIDSGLSSKSHVTLREDYWNGCIFQIDDSELKGPQSFDSEIRFIILEGWLKPSGSVRSTLVKSDYEHNFTKIGVALSFEVTNLFLDNATFGLHVEYNKNNVNWQRTSGARQCIIP